MSGPIKMPAYFCSCWKVAGDLYFCVYSIQDFLSTGLKAGPEMQLSDKERFHHFLHLDRSLLAMQQGIVHCSDNSIPTAIKMF